MTIRVHRNKLQSPQQTVAIYLLLILHNLSFSLYLYEKTFSLQNQINNQPLQEETKKQHNLLSLSPLGLFFLSLKWPSWTKIYVEQRRKTKKRKDGKIGEKERYVSSNVLQPLLFYTASSHKYPFFFTTLLPIFMGLLGFSLSPCLSETKLHTQTRPSLLLLSLSIITSPFCSLSLSLQSQSLSTYWVCGCFFFALFPSFVCGFNGFSPTLSLVFLSLYLIWVSVFWA